MTPTMSEYFERVEELALRRRRQGDREGVRRRLATQDIGDILGGLVLVYDSVEPRSPRPTPTAGAARPATTCAACTASPRGCAREEAGGKKFTAADADTLGTEAQDRAEAIAGQISQAAGQLGIELEN